jgi:anaerobic magnesium-protoporphyrin IX monomethyl ester cyclase
LKKISKIRKVLLIRPPTITVKESYDINPLQPLGLGYLASVLLNMGIEVEIYDSLIEFWHSPVPYGKNKLFIGPDSKQLKEIIKKSDPDLVGVSVMFSNQNKSAVEVYRCIKEIDKNIIVVAGGAHPSVLPEETLHDPNVDFVILGEGEESFKDVIRYFEGKFSAEFFDGVGYKKNNEIFIKPKTKFIQDLDNIPFPAWHLMQVEKYFGLKNSHSSRQKKNFMPVVTSRGCPAQCVFCSADKVWGKKYRARSVENIIQEMRILKNDYGIEEIVFEDDNLTLDRERAKQLCRMMLDEEFNFVWDTPNGVAAYALDEELIKLMKRAGCAEIIIAVESGVQKTLDKIIRKPLKLKKVDEVLRIANEIEIPVSACFIVGLPGETLEDIEETFIYASKKSFKDCFFSLATPYPGSELFKKCLENDFFSKEYRLEDLYLWSYMIETNDWTISELKEIITRKKKLFNAE